MPPKGRRSAKAKQAQDPKGTQAYDHGKTLLLRPDVRLQSQFKQKKAPKTYRYDPSLDPVLSWDGNADCEWNSGRTRSQSKRNLLLK